MSKIILIQSVCTEYGTKKKEESTSTMRTKTHSARCFCSLRQWMSVGIFHCSTLMLQTLNGIRKFSA